MKSKIEKKELLIVISTFVILLLIHFPLMTKNIITADVLLNNDFYKGYSWELSLGRYGLFLLGIIKNYLSIPHIELIISYSLISIQTLLLIKLFDIKEKVPIILTILFMCLSPIISATLLFHYCSAGYLLAALGGTIALYSYYKIEDKKLRIIIPIVTIVLSLSMYQAYLSYIITLFVLYQLKLLFDKKSNWKDSINYLIIIGISIILYFISMKIAQIIFHIDMSNYSNANSIGLSTLLSFPNKIIDSYTLFYQFLFKNDFIKNTYFYNHILNLVLIVLFIISIIFNIIKKALEKKEIIISIVIILLLPIFLNSIIFVIADTKLQLLMSASYLLLPIFLFSILEYKYTKIITIIICTILYRNYIIQVQSTYITLNKTYNTYHTIIESVVEQNINQKDKKYAIIGKINNIDNKLEKLNYGYISDEDIFWDEYNLRKLGFERFTEQYLGFKTIFVEEDTYNKLVNNQKKDLVYEQYNNIVINLNNY